MSIVFQKYFSNGIGHTFLQFSALARLLLPKSGLIFTTIKKSGREKSNIYMFEKGHSFTGNDNCREKLLLVEEMLNGSQHLADIVF